MKSPPMKLNKETTSEQKVDLYFEWIEYRQLLEEEYYNSGDSSLLKNVEEARAYIREIQKELGFDALVN